MTLYDLRIDRDCTTRSRAVSTGIMYPTEDAAQAALDTMNIEAWQYATIEAVEVRDN